MANESTTSSLDDISQSAAIEETFHDYGHQYRVAAPFLYEKDLRGKGSGTWQVPLLTSIVGSPSSTRGDSVDTEFDGIEGTPASNTQRATSKKTISSSEYVIMFTVTDDVLEDSVDGLDIVGALIEDAARVLLTAEEYDICANFSNFSNTVGTTNTAMALADMNSAIVTLRNEGIQASGGIVYILDKAQAEDFEDGLAATNSATAVLPGTADKFYDYVRDEDNGLNNGLLGHYRGNPVFQSHLCQADGTDATGAAFVPVQSNKKMAALGKTLSRALRVETQRTAEGRGTKVVLSMRTGSGELLDEAGVGIVTKQS